MKSGLIKNVAYILDHSPDSVVTSAGRQVMDYILKGVYGYRHEYMRLVCLYLDHMDRGGNYDADSLLAMMSEDYLVFDSKYVVNDDSSFWLPEDKIENGPTLFDSFEF